MFLKLGSIKIAFTGLDKIIYFLLIPLITTELSKNEFGILQTYLSWVSILAIIIGLSLSSMIRSSYHKKNFNSKLFKETSHTYNIIILPLLILSLFVLGKIINVKWIYTLGTLCVIQAIFTTILNTEKIYFIVYKKLKYEIIVSNLVPIISSIFTFLLFYFVNDHFFNLRLFSLIFPLIIVASLILYFSKFSFRFNSSYFKSAVKKTSPLIIHSLSILLLFQIDRTFLLYFLGGEETGIYSFAQLVSSIPLIFLTALESVWIPFFNESYLNNQVSKLRKIYYLYVLFGFTFFVLTIILSPLLVSVLSKGTYNDSIEYVLPLVVSNLLIFGYSFFINQKLIDGDFKSITKITISSTLINCVLNFVLIPILGIQGAVISTLISYLYLYINHGLTSNKNIRFMFIPFFVLIISFIVYYYINFKI